MGLFMCIRFMVVVKTIPQVKISTKKARNFKFCTVQTLFLKSPKIPKFHALSADFLLMSAFPGQKFLKYCENWTIFKLLYLGNK